LTINDEIPESYFFFTLRNLNFTYKLNEDEKNKEKTKFELLLTIRKLKMRDVSLISKES
jgi:hypothetical protein